MGHVQVQGADIEDGTIKALRVKIHGLPARTIDRPTALAWLKDGHSLVPVVDGREGTALQLVEVADGEQSARYIRLDNEKTAADALPPLPPVEKAH